MTLKFTVYRKTQPLPDVPFEQIGDLLREADTFVWLIIKDPTTEQLERIQRQFRLHELAVEDALTSHQRPKLEAYDQTIFLAVHTARLKEEAIVYGQLHVFVARKFIILIQHGGSMHHEGLRSRCERSPALFANSPGFALYTVLDHLIDEQLPISEHFQKQLDGLESAIFGTHLDRLLIEKLYELKKEIAQLHNAAAPVAEICAELSRLHPDIVTPELRPYYRDVQDHVQRITRTSAMLREALSDAMQVNLALVTARQNEVVKRLAGWGAVLAIPTMVFSMHGMNFKYIPEYEWEMGFPLTLLITAYACRELYLKLKRANWL